MRANRRRDTAIELAIRRRLHARGLRYRVDTSPIAGMRSKADLVFRPRRVAVFVDGCFWHGCPEHWAVPKANRAWWEAKIANNRARDERTDAALSAAGWRVVRCWEHEDPDEAVERIVAVLDSVD